MNVSMDKVDFKTPISYGEHKQGIVDYLVEGFDDYFCFRGKKACVIPGNRLHAKLKAMSPSKYPLLRLALKVVQLISYLTIAVPLFMLTGKAILRNTRKIELKTDIQSINVNPIDPRLANPKYLFLARQVGRSQEGCSGNISLKKTAIVRQKIQEKAPLGIFFDSSRYAKNSSIRGTCTAMSLEFASIYFRLRQELKDMSPGSETFLDKMRLLKEKFEISSKEMRSRQFAYSSITVDRTVKMDISRTKIESCISFHDFETDYCSQEVDLTADTGLLKQEINALPYGVYFIRMLMPADNHKLEARGHSMIYVHDKDVGFFYDNNCGLEKLSAMNSGTDGTELYERLLNVYKEWDIPKVRFYGLKPKLSDENDCTSRKDQDQTNDALALKLG